ncbi:AAA family ATPase [Larkinella sp. GY13]|uniref:AAA family ATPase n=1 Tax=Larkinella sp. GY13 TaxID=3453720 RepID=UPI003EEF6543
MQITKLHLTNFKRFTDLTIDGIPADAKLVLLIGSNGSGKSSVFDAFEYVNSESRHSKFEKNDSTYYTKNTDHGSFNLEIMLASGMIAESISSDSSSPYGRIRISTIKDTVTANNFYGRTSFRQIPRLKRTQLGQIDTVNFEEDSDRPRFFVDRDDRFENDIEKISERILKEIFREKASGEQITKTYIDPINRALDNIFGLQQNTKLSLLEIIPPLEGKIAQITFKKGESEIHYNYLSAGEKEVVNILFNLLVRRDQFTDTVYFFDEIDLHLHTKLQFNLLKELTENWIPDHCQLWTSSHSLGFIDYTRQYENGVIIDFDDLDFDQPQVLLPQSKERLDVYDIAVPKEILFELMLGKRLVVCENQNDEYYNLLVLPETVFVGVKDARDVFMHIKRDARYHSIRDRDFLSDSEIERIGKSYPNHHILRYYDFENYLYHPDNLAEVNPAGFSREEYILEIIRQKNERKYHIIATLHSSRQTYEEFKTDEKLKDKSIDFIIDDFKSDEFERFYKYFDMKVQFNRAILTAFNLDKKRLVQTSWFRQQIEKILHS